MRRLRPALAEHLVGQLGEGNCCRKVVEEAGRVAGTADADAALHCADTRGQLRGEREGLILRADALSFLHLPTKEHTRRGLWEDQSWKRADLRHRVPNAGKRLVNDVVDVPSEADGRVPEAFAQ